MSTRTEITIASEVGLHARPAGAFVKRAAGYESSVTVRHGDRTADASSLLQVLKLEAGKGATVVIEAEGPDEEEAVAGLVELLESFT